MKKTMIIGLVLALVSVLVVASSVSSAGTTPTTLATYTNGNVVCTAVNNGDGTGSFGCTMPLATLTNLGAALSNNYGYHANITNSTGSVVPNPETSGEFDLRVGIYQYLSDEYYQYQLSQWTASKPTNTFSN